MGRGVSCLLGSCAFVCFGVLSPHEAFAAIDLPTIALLTGCMMISAHAEKAGLHKWLAAALAAKASPLVLLVRVSLTSAIASAFITNDTACIVLTPLVVDAARGARRSPLPFLIATATSANIGSALSPVGNPQNMIIALQSGLLFTDFLKAITLATIFGLLINGAVIARVYGHDLFTETIGDGDVVGVAQGAAATTAAAPREPAGPSEAAAQLSGRDVFRSRAVTVLLAAVPVLLVVADLWIGLVWMSLLCAALLFAIDGAPPAALLARVDSSLLFFFSGLFVCTAGLNATGLPAAAWAALAAHASLARSSGLFVFSLLVAAGSNSVSNVPLVLLLAPALSALPAAEARCAWLVLAWTSTVGGNLTLLGAVANVIVAERARSEGAQVSFFEWLRAGIPSTIFTLIVGTPIVWSIARM
jgi:Na+/H+ antiporter NhaD/arsenite permease-like protein